MHAIPRGADRIRTADIQTAGTAGLTERAVRTKTELVLKVFGLGELAHQAPAFFQRRGQSFGVARRKIPDGRHAMRNQGHTGQIDDQSERAIARRIEWRRDRYTRPDKRRPKAAQPAFQARDPGVCGPHPAIAFVYADLTRLRRSQHRSGRQRLLEYTRDIDRAIADDQKRTGQAINDSITARGRPGREGRQ